MAFPPQLSQAVADEAGGKVALIVGAGCSFEQPTGLPLSRPLSAEAHRRLVDDHVLEAEDCADPADLSVLADAVFNKTNSQAALVNRVPLMRFRNASPNQGYLIAGALLREHAVRAILTLNFDLAAQHALSAINAGSEVSVLRGPQDMAAAGVVNLVHLHRDAYAAPDDWILRTEQIDDAWRDGWEELVTTRVMSTPVVVFAGLGTAAAVLVETIGRVRGAIDDHVSIHVDPGVYGASDFSATIAIPEDRYVRAGWGEFMVELGQRVALEQTARLRAAVTEFEAQAGVPAQDNESVLSILEQMTLLQLGELRARWLLRRDAYLPARIVDLRLLADLVQGAALLARELGVVLVAETEGQLQMRSEGVVVGIVAPASGAGVFDWARFEAEISSHRRSRSAVRGDLVVILAAGVTGNREAIAPPENLIAEEHADDAAGGYLAPLIIDVGALRADPEATLGALR